jgi:hypothetical protein
VQQTDDSGSSDSACHFTACHLLSRMFASSLLAL